MVKAYLYLFMIGFGLVCIYVGAYWLETGPQGPMRNIASLTHFGGFFLCFYGLLYAKDVCEKELINRHRDKDSTKEA